MSRAGLCCFAAVLVSCTSAPLYRPTIKTRNVQAAAAVPALKSVQGEASYYAHKFHGRRTANGETFNMNAMTAAHKTWPFNTIVLVTNLENNKSVKVRINDRGPFVKNRIIDLSLEAAKKLDMLKSGTAHVRIDILEWGPTN